MIRQLQGDCRITLPGLQPGIAQVCITSPPYYGLRSYLPDGHPMKPHEIGLESTPELYIEHIVECFSAVKRVLRDDGVCWINLGDSYAGSGKGPSNSLQSEASQLGKRNAAQFMNGQAPTQWISVGSGYKPKDLMMMPFRVAMALQADGWWIRSVIPWLKRNAMPESVTDRPATSVEYVFLLSKRSRYFWDADAVRMEHAEPWRSSGKSEKNNWSVDGRRGSHDTVREYNPLGRSRRNGDWFFESWQGLLLDEQDDPLALVVNPQPFKGSHFATFPPKLVEPMVKASTSEKGQCPECGAPWVRIIDKGELVNPRNATSSRVTRGDGQRMPIDRPDIQPISGAFYERTLIGWRPSCKHDAKPVPQIVLDLFGGAGTVGLVADRLGRNAVLCELSDAYAPMAAQRIVGDAPLFTEIEGCEPGSTEAVIDKQAALGKSTYSGFNARWDAKKRAAD